MYPTVQIQGPGLVVPIDRKLALLHDVQLLD